MTSSRESKMSSLCSGWTGYYIRTSGVCQRGASCANCLLYVCCRRPDDWTLSAGGSGTIYGWGHNHRGQLGGIEGAKVKVPTPCEALATLRPVQLIGGEQTLFAVTADGKVSVHFLCQVDIKSVNCYGWRALWVHSMYKDSVLKHHLKINSPNSYHSEMFLNDL